MLSDSFKVKTVLRGKRFINIFLKFVLHNFLPELCVLIYVLEKSKFEGNRVHHSIRSALCLEIAALLLILF